MILTMLGTGNAQATACYNTCLTLHCKEGILLVDGGGGNGLFTQLSRAHIDWKDIRHIFVTHKHIDHLLGIVWMVRRICQAMNQGKYEGEAFLYAHDEVISTLRALVPMLLGEKIARPIGGRFHLVTVQDGEEKTILGTPFTFLDIHSAKVKQFGFAAGLEDGGRLVCCGDEPYHPALKPYAEGCTWLLHEAFCLSGEADIFRPYEKHHSTVKDACRTAQALGVQHLILYHTEDSRLPARKALYLEEGAQHYTGPLFVPDDLETFIL